MGISEAMFFFDRLKIDYFYNVFHMKYLFTIACEHRSASDSFSKYVCPSVSEMG